MGDHPILYSAPMIRALLAGTKTQTRRILKWGNGAPVWDGEGLPTNDPSKWGFPYYDKSSDSTEIRYLPNVPRYKVGDRLWVREAHYLTDEGDFQVTVYAADEESTRQHLDSARRTAKQHSLSEEWLAPHIRLRPSIHMPRWASRLTQVVKDVRVQRLNEISEEDVLAEGVDPFDSQIVSYRAEYRDGAAVSSKEVRTRIPAYRRLWESINGPGSWDANPWVAAYTFETHHHNIDLMPAEAA